MKDLQKQFQDRLADASTVAEEIIANVRTVRAFSGEKKGEKSYDKHIMESYDVAKKIALGAGN